MPAKGTTKISEEQKLKIAKLKLRGVRGEDVARAVNVSEARVSTIWNSPEIRAIVAQARVYHAPKMQALFGQILDTIAEDLGKAKTIDERTKLRVHAYEVLMRGEPTQMEQAAQPAAGTAGAMQWSELLVQLRGGAAAMAQPAPVNGHANGNGHNGVA